MLARMGRTWHLPHSTTVARPSAAPAAELVADASAEVAGEEEELVSEEDALEVEEARLICAHKVQLRKA